MSSSLATDAQVDDALHARVFVRAPIYDLIFACLSPRTLIRLAWTCRTACAAVAEFKGRAFNINRHLSYYFTDPIAFRSLQARTNTLISGSNALQFLDRTFYSEADLDLYTHPGHSFEVAQFLVEKEGYHHVPRETQESDWREATASSQDLTSTIHRLGVSPGGGINHHSQEYPTTEIEAVWTFKKKGVHLERLKVQIIEGRSSAFEAILGFHSTCVMNVISSDAAYSLYPVATFENRSTLCLRNSNSAPKALQKYAKRGWRVYFVPAPDDRAFFAERKRLVNDKYTWRLPLDQTGVQPRPPPSPNSAPLTCDPVLFNGWEVRPSWRPKVVDGLLVKPYECHYYPLKTTLFRYNYAIPRRSVRRAIREWAAQQGQISQLLLSKDDWIWFDADIASFWRKK